MNRSIPLLLAAAMASVILHGAWAVRPRLRRPALGPVAEPKPAPRRPLVELSARLGTLVLTRIRGRGCAPPSELAATATGSAVVAGGAMAVAAGPLAALVACGVVAGLPHLQHQRRQRSAEASFSADLPEVVDLLSLALSSGLNVPLAVAAVGRRGVGPLSRELARVAEESAKGRRLAEALEDLGARCGPATHPLMAVLAAGERYGVPLVESLERLAVDVRAADRRRAEEAARRLPVKMLFPLVACILPAFGLLTLGPMVLTSLGALPL